MAGSDLISKYNELKVSFEAGQLIGVDIGLSSVKMCVLEEGRKGKYKITSYHSVFLSEAVIIEDEIQKPDEVIDAVMSSVNAMKLKKKIACLGVKGPNTVTKRLKVPDGGDEEVEDNVIWESEQYLPFNAEDAAIDFSVLERNVEEDILDVIVGAVKIDTVERYMEYLKQAGIFVRVVDLNVFAIVNAFEVIYKDGLDEIDDNGGAIIIDFGAQYTTVVVYKNSGPVLTKEINIGGVLITEEIQRTMGVSYEEAEDLKINGDENGNLPEDIITIMKSHTSKLMDELKKVLNFFISAGSSEQVGSCFVTGGSSKIPGLLEALSVLVELEVEEIDPLEGFELKAKLNDEEMYSLQTSGLSVLGLAMRKIE